MAKKSKPQKQPFLPLFVGDFLGATDEWEGEEQGLYLACMARQWIVGSLPADPMKLCRQLKWSQPNFDRYWPVVSRKFVEFEDAELGLRLRNIRLEEHRQKSIEIGKKNSEAGKKGAAKTWRKDGERHTENMANATDSDGERHKSAMQKVMAPGHGNPSHPIPSHPDPSQVLPPSPQVPCVSTPNPQPRTSRENAPESSGNPDSAYELTEAIKAIYPQGTYGQQNWILAQREIGKLLEAGERPDVLLACARAFAQQQSAKGSTGTQFIRGPEKFFGGGFWRGPFPLPAAGQAASPKRTRTSREIAEALDPDNTALGAA